MKQILVAIRDIQADTYGRPIAVRSTGEAMRIFSDEINRPAADNVMYNHPEDFELWNLGNYDEETGQLEQEKPTQITTGKAVTTKKEA